MALACPREQCWQLRVQQSVGVFDSSDAMGNRGESNEHQDKHQNPLKHIRGSDGLHPSSNHVHHNHNREQERSDSVRHSAIRHACKQIAGANGLQGEIGQGEDQHHQKDQKPCAFPRDAMPDQFGGCDQSMGSADPSDPAADASEAEAREARSQGHHRVVGKTDSIPCTCETEKKEGTEIRGNQCEKKDTGLQASVCQKILICAGRVTVVRLGA